MTKHDEISNGTFWNVLEYFRTLLYKRSEFYNSFDLISLNIIYMWSGKKVMRKNNKNQLAVIYNNK